MLNLVMTKNVNNTNVDGYLDGHTPYFTREQIGSALEYENPQKAIDNIHARHKDRLDLFSVTLNLKATDNKEYKTVVYSNRGIFEICRWSRQPKAGMVMDALYDMAEEVMTKGYFSMMSDEALAQLLDEKVNRQVGGKQRIRESRKEQTVFLDLERNNISHEDYLLQLRCIWGEDTTGYHKAFDEYMNWYNGMARKKAALQ